MAEQRPREQGLAWAELNLLNVAHALPTALDGARFGAATPIYDLNGQELYVRFPLLRGNQALGYADTATSPAFGALLLAAAPGATWNERAILKEAQEAARLPHRPDTVRFVAYSYPKLAVQFLAEGQELALLELWTWREVPPRSDRRKDEPPSDFERWSFLDEQPAEVLRRNRTRYRKRADAIEDLLKRARRVPKDKISREVFEPVIRRDILKLLFETRDVHYSTRDADHFTCYEVRGQQTSVWCVAASVQMLLDFYRYEYTQVRLAAELGLGTLANPNGLPYTRDGDVVTVVEAMSSGALDASMTMTPSWTEFRNEIRANRPLISFVPGHARTVAGYTRSGLAFGGLTPFRGLLVYDPWPPNVGVITRWENFDATTYRRTFTAHVNLA
jgi:peptidase C39-like protein